MSNPPWMPLHIADYLRDTTHLDAEQSGAYLHLIMAYWVAGKLPNDNRKLALIAKLSPQKWRYQKSVLEPFFGPGFSSHKRIDLELQLAAKLMEKRSARARQAALKRWANGYAPSMLQAMLGDAHLQRKK